MKKIAVIGEGAWGTAVATLLAHNGHTVFLWCHDQAVKESIEQTRINHRYLPNIKLSPRIIPHTDLNHVIKEAEYIFETTPVKFLRSVLNHIDPAYVHEKPWIVLSKGIEKDTLLVPSQIITSLFQEAPIAIVSGPSFALELAQQKETAFVVASNNSSLIPEIEALLSNHYVKTVSCNDPMGVQLCAALKNVLALALGIFQGAGLAQNTTFYLFTQGFHEMINLVQACGGQPETVLGLAGFGDLILTSFGSLSRNTMVGKRLGQGQTLETILRETGAIPEGINTLQSVYELIEQKGFKLSFMNGIYRIVFNKLSLKGFINTLMK